MHAKGSMASSGIKDRALKLLASYPSGLHPEQISESLGASKQSTSDALFRLGKDGLVAAVDDPIGKMTRRRRWCLPEHIETCREAVCRNGTKSPNLKGTRHAGAALRPETSSSGMSEPARSCGSCVPLAPDLRFTVAAPEQFFSRPGYRPDMLKTGSAIESAYGGGND